MDKLKITIERDSVSAGDDINAPNSIKFSLSSSSTIVDLFTILAKKRYLPSIVGENHSWDVIINKKKIAKFRGNKNEPESSKELESSLLTYATNGNINVLFSYNRSKT